VRRDTGRQSDPQLLSMTLPVPPGTSRHASWTAARASASGYSDAAEEHVARGNLGRVADDAVDM